MESKVPRSLWRAYAMLLASSGMFLFWVAAFIYNGLPHYSYTDQIYKGVGDWPFAATTGVTSGLITPAVVGGLFANLILPVAALFILHRTVTQWTTLSNIQRGWCGSGVVFVLAVLFVWVSFSYPVYSWILD